MARSISGAFDSFIEGAINNATIEHIGRIDLPFLCEYPDFLAVLLVFFCFIVVSIKANFFSYFTSIFSIINIVVLTVIIGVGVYLGDLEYSTSNGLESFMPYGFSGVAAASASCFYSYNGFEAVTSSAEESKNQKKDIPLALTFIIVLGSILYMAASASLILMMPINSINILAPFPEALKYHNFIVIGNLIAFGTMIRMLGCLLNSFYAMTRTLYSIASDALVFTQLSYVNTKTRTPLASTAFSTMIALILILFVDMEMLVEFISIGTLLSFTFVAINKLILRYTPQDNCLRPIDANSALLTSSKKPNIFNELTKTDETESNTNTTNDCQIGTLKRPFSFIYGSKKLPKKNVGPTGVIGIMVSSSVICLVLLYAKDVLLGREWWAVMLMSVSAVCFIGFFLLLWAHHHKKTSNTFQVRFAMKKFDFS